VSYSPVPEPPPSPSYEPGIPPVYSYGAEPPLDRPHYGIGPVDAVRRGFRKYATFAGRASRSEFWWWELFVVAGYVVFGLGAFAVGTATSPNGGRDPGSLGIVLALVLVIFMLGILVPTIAVSVRRLHDAGYSGWLYLLVLVPYLGGLIVLVFCALRSSPAGLRYDQQPARTPLYPPR
jgi:uncharacterized membrane protein YhaH (DUF805 family)